MWVRYLILTGCLLSVAIYLVYNFTDVALYYGGNYESITELGDEDENDNSVTNTTEHCPNKRIITVHDLGNIGNVIWEYMSLYAVWKLYAKKERIKPYLKEGMKKTLEGFFEGLSIPGRTITYNDTVHATMLPRDEPTRPEFIINGCRNLLINNSSVRYEEVLQLGVADLKKELRFREKYVSEASKTLRSIQSSFGLQGKNVTFVGMHYRGTDYIAHLKRFHRKTFKGPPDYKYYVGGMNYFKARHEKVIFVLTTIDGDWLKKNEPFLTQNGNVAINPYKKSAVKDLVLLSNCNHTIVNYGTYGVTAALLNEGTTIVYDLGVPLNHRGQTVATGIATILENWLVFGFDGNITVI